MSSTQLYKKIFRSSAIYSIAVFAPMLVSVVMLPIYAKFLTADDYAVVDLLETTRNLFSMLIGGRFADSLFYFYSKTEEPQERKKLLGTLVIGSLLVGAAGAVVGVVAAPLLSRMVFETGKYGEYFAIVFVAFGLSIPMEAGLAWLRARDSAGLFVVSALARLALQVTLTVTLLTVLKWGIPGILWSGLLTNGIIGLALAGACLWANGFGFVSSTFQEMFAFAVPLGLSGLAMFVVHSGNRFFLQRTISLTELGLYSLAYRIGMLVSFAQSSFQSYWTAGVYDAVKGDQAETVFARVNTYQLLAVTYLGLLLVVVSPPFLQVAAPRFIGALPFIPLVVVAYVIRAEADYYRFALFLDKQVGLDAKLNWAAAVFCLAAYATLIPAFGAWGAIAASAATFAFLLWLVRWRLHKTRPYRLERARLIKMLATAAVLGGIALLLPRGVFLLTASYAILAALLYPVLLHFLRFFDQTELQGISNLAARFLPGARKSVAQASK
jgi:O-antigen/teichoic acid export membrane protein